MEIDDLILMSREVARFFFSKKNFGAQNRRLVAMIYDNFWYRSTRVELILISTKRQNFFCSTTFFYCVFTLSVVGMRVSNKKQSTLA